MFAKRALFPRISVTFPLFALAVTLAQAQVLDFPAKDQPGIKWTPEQLKQALAPMRAGRPLTPKRWPKGAKVAVCLSWDIDGDAGPLLTGKPEPVTVSQAEYDVKVGLPRILALYERHHIPGSFYIPAVVGLLHPELIEQFKQHPQHEVGLHGWIHEYLPGLNDRAEEQRLLRQAIDFWTQALGHKPAGYRAPAWQFSPYTLELISQAGLEYDSSAMAMDEPYELLSAGKPTGLVELPVSSILDDADYLKADGTMPSPELLLKVYEDEFDVAYREGTLFMLTMHPAFTSHRSRIIYLERLIEHMKSKPGVWFATGQQIAAYAKQQSQAGS